MASLTSRKTCLGKYLMLSTVNELCRMQLYKLSDSIREMSSRLMHHGPGIVESRHDDISKVACIDGSYII